MKKGYLAAGLLLLCLWTAGMQGCGGQTESPPGENAKLTEVRYYSRAWGEKEKENSLLRTVRFVQEEGKVIKKTLDAYGRLVAEETYSPAGELLLSQTYFLAENGEVEGSNKSVYTLKNGKPVEEKTYRDGELDLLYTREYDGQGELAYEQLYRMVDGEKVIQYTHRFASSYDDAGRLTEQIYTCDEEPAQNTHTRFAYNEKGDLTRQAEIRYDREYYVTEYTRDEYGNLLEERKLEDGVQQSKMSYRYTCDGQGRVLRREDLSADPVSVTEYSYDGEGRCVSTVSSVGGRKVTSGEFSYSFAGTFPRRIVQTTLQYDGETPVGEVYTTVYAYDGETTRPMSELLLSLAAG